MLNFDRLITVFDNSLRTLLGPARSARPLPGVDIGETEMSDVERKLAASLMRVNHSGEICAQALYQGQALTSRNSETRAALERASVEETDHLAWTAQRIAELGGRVSMLNPLWYVGSFTLGAAAGLFGNKWNLGFLAETERQVEGHLAGHMDRLPARDEKSHAILDQMKRDEASHARNAIEHGAAELPTPVKFAMKMTSRVMTRTAFWL